MIADHGWSRKIMEDALGVTPIMIEPPFGDIGDRIRIISITLGVDSSHHGTSSLLPFQYSPSSYSPRLTMHCRLRPPLHCHLSASPSTASEQLSPATPQKDLIRPPSSLALYLGFKTERTSSLFPFPPSIVVHFSPHPSMHIVPWTPYILMLTTRPRHSPSHQLSGLIRRRSAQIPSHRRRCSWQLSG
jgi:hypothetical protein